MPVSDDTLTADLRATAEAVASGWPIAKLAEAKRRGEGEERPAPSPPAQVLSRHGVGASEIAAACGISRYRTRFGLWLEKTGRVAPFAGNIHTRLGQLCEPRARQLYANATGQDIVTPAASMFHPDHPWARATPDGWWASDPARAVQFKCVGYFVGRRWKYEIPIEVEAQCQWEMFVNGATVNDLAVLIGTDELAWERFILGEIDDPARVFDAASLHIVPIYRDEAAIAALFAGARAFWSMVEADTQPAIDHSPECRDWLNRKTVAAVALEYADHAAAVDELATAYADARAATKALDLAKNRIRDVLATAGANRIKTDDGPILWTANKQLRVPAAWSKEEEQA